MTITLNPAFEELAHVFGYRSALDFTRIQLQHMATQKIAYYQSRVDFYEQKYGMDYETFIKCVVNQEDPVLKKFGIIEKEDDDFDWEDALYFVASYTEKLHALGS